MLVFCNRELKQIQKECSLSTTVQNTVRLTQSNMEESIYWRNLADGKRFVFWSS